MTFFKQLLYLVTCFSVSVSLTLAADSDLDPTFSTGSGVNGTPIAMALQTDGKIVIGGNFDVVAGVRRGKVARLNADGSLDTTFTRGYGVDGNGIVWCLAVQADGKVLIGGEFSSVNGTPQPFLARLNSDGSLDTSFSPQISDRVLQIAVQPDNKILIGGDFQSVNGSFTSRRLARLNADGTQDTSFVYSLATDLPPAAIQIQTDGKIIVTGNNRVARLNVNGSLDNFNNFNPGITGYANAIGYAAIDGSILFGGSITAYNGVPQSNLVRVFANGALFPGFSPQITGGAINSVEFLPDGKILIAGFFTSVNGVSRNGFARLNFDGTLDTSFNPTASPIAFSKILLPSDGKYIVGGQFTTIAGVARNRIARLNPDGTIDAGFAKKRGADSSIFSVVPLSDGKMLIGGDFQNVEETPIGGIARLTSNGSLDTAFNSSGSGVDGDVGKVALQQDGKILIGGFFTNYNGTSRKSIARLNADGSLDGSFDAGSGIEAIITDIEIQPDGKIIIVGLFANVGGIPGRNIVRLNADGSIDSSFNPGTGADLEIYDVERQSDGKILIGGNFDNYNGMSRSSVARLNSNGSLDASFNNGTVFDSAVLSLVTQPNGRIVVGGAFNNVNGTPRNKVVRLNTDGSVDTSFTLGGGFSAGEVFKVALQPDGKIIAGGTFSALGNGVSRPRLTRLSPDGTVEAAFNVPGITLTGGDSEVNDIAFQSDGRILVAGNFTQVNGVESNRIFRLMGAYVAPTGSAPFDFDGDGKADVSVFRPSNGSWYVSRSNNGQLFAPQFGQSGDKVASADFDGDGKYDIAIFRPANGSWYILQSSNGAVLSIQFGASEDLPVPADFDGDGRSEIAVFRPSNGAWYRLNLTTNQFLAINFGQAGDIPQTGDFDGDGRADITVFRPSNGFWYRINSSNNQFVGIQFGLNGDLPVSADYDGDRKVDIGVFRPSNGTWYRLNSGNGQFIALLFGSNEDKPVAADYDGDGKADVATFRPSNGVWYLQRSSSGFASVQFGAGSDVPVPTMLLP